MPDLLQAIIDMIVETAEPDRIVLFGSRGQGKGAADSDYDILVLKRGVTYRRRLARAIYLELADIPAPVDVIVEDPDRIEKYRNTPGFIYSEALNGRVVYER
ncbi:MAG: nucleotidyltransferase domain-containing protein [Bacillota bacterium]|jgi:predicted nucleotidyltransferase